MSRWVCAAAGLLALTCLLPSGCKSAEERDTAKEVGRIAFAVQQLREAPNNEKVAPLERLRAEPCSTPPGCELQQLCVQGYAIQERVLKTTRAVREALRAGNANRAGAADLLKSSEADLARAKKLMDQCVETEGRLAREYF